MREIQIKMDQQNILNPQIDFFLNSFVWEAFHKAKEEDLFTVKILFFRKDISSIVAGLLTKWFGPDPDKQG